MEYTIIICADQIELAYPIAALIKNLEDHLISVVIANARCLANEAIIQNLTNSILITGQKPGITESPEKNKNKRVNFILLNIGPENGSDEQDIVSFIDNHEKNISFWIDTAHNWPLSILKFANRSKKIVTVDRTKSCLEIIRALGFKTQADWEEAETAFSQDKRLDLLDNYPSNRLLISDNVSHNMQANLEDDHVYTTFKFALQEIISNKQSEYIDNLIDISKKIKHRTDELKDMIETKSIQFFKSLEIEKDAAYIDLGEIESFIDIQELLDYGAEKYPWLFAIYCCINGVRKLRPASKKINMEAVFASEDKKLFEPFRLFYIFKNKIIDSDNDNNKSSTL